MLVLVLVLVLEPKARPHGGVKSQIEQNLDFDEHHVYFQQKSYGETTHLLQVSNISNSHKQTLIFHERLVSFKNNYTRGGNKSPAGGKQSPNYKTHRILMETLHEERHTIPCWWRAYPQFTKRTWISIEGHVSLHQGMQTIPCDHDFCISSSTGK